MLIPIYASLLAAPVPQCSTDFCSKTSAYEQLCSAAVKDVEYFATDNVLCFRGVIDWAGGPFEKGEHWRAVKKLKLRKNIIVVLNSNGGEATNAIGITRHLQKYQYTAYASGKCFSACAQFLFMGAKNRVIGLKAMVGIHGGQFTKEMIDAMELPNKVRKDVILANDAFEKFYSENGLPIEIIYDFPDEVRKDFGPGKVVMWSPNQKDYDRFGIPVSYCK